MGLVEIEKQLMKEGSNSGSNEMTIHWLLRETSDCPMKCEDQGFEGGETGICWWWW